MWTMSTRYRTLNVGKNRLNGRKFVFLRWDLHQIIVFMEIFRSQSSKWPKIWSGTSWNSIAALGLPQLGWNKNIRWLDAILAIRDVLCSEMSTGISTPRPTIELMRSTSWGNYLYDFLVTIFQILRRICQAKHNLLGVYDSERTAYDLAKCCYVGDCWSWTV